MKRLSFLIALLIIAPVDASAAGPYPRRTPIVEAVEKSRPSVVNIHAETLVRRQMGWPFDIFAPEIARVPSLGSGVVVSAQGYIVTNWHVVEHVHSIRVRFYDKQVREAELVARDPERDLAVLRVPVDARQPLPAIALGTSGDLMIGETVIAIGNAMGYEHTVTTGVISAVKRNIRADEKRELKGMIQTDASINPGNSGGPLLNINGQLIGINTAIRGDAQLIGFAIPVDVVKQTVGELFSLHVAQHVWHGLTVEELPTGSAVVDAGSGVRVAKVDHTAPAGLSDIQVGDVIHEIAGQRVGNAIDFGAALLGRQVGERVALRLARNGTSRLVALTLAAPPLSDRERLFLRRLGIKVRELEPTEAERLPRIVPGGVVVTDVEPSGPAHQAQMKAGDVLVQLHRYNTTSLNQLEAILNVLPGQHTVLVYWVRGRRIFRSQVRLQKIS